MNYSNVQVLKELKRIQKCLLLPYSKQEGNEDIRKCIYDSDHIGIMDYLIETKLVNMNTLEDKIIIPYITPYGKDFLKQGLLRCYIKDHIFNIIAVIGAIGAIFTILDYYFK